MALAPAHGRPVLYQGRAFYLGADDSIGQILCFDGTTEFEFCRLPFGPAATTGGLKTDCIGMAMGFLYVSNNNGTNGQVWKVDPVTGGCQIICTRFTYANEVVSDIIGHAGRVWVATRKAQGTAAHIYSMRPDVDTAWTTERTTTDLGGTKFRDYNSLIAAGGILYAATSAPAGFAALIEKRSAAGTWSTELTSGDTTNFNYYDSLTSWGGVLYAQFAGGAVLRVVKQDSVGTWSTDKDMAAAGSTETWGFRATPAVLFASAPPRVFTKTGSTWATSLSDADLTHGLII
jgi:hypothetical protein